MAMKWFDYENPKTLSEAIELISKYGDDSRLIAGGTDLIVQMRIGRRTPKVVINTKAVEEMNQLTCDSSGLTIGAAVPCYKIYQNSEIISAYPGIIDSASLIGGIQIQGRATLGGNLCNAAPSGDAICPLIVYGATANIAGPNGERKIAVEDFCVGPGKTVLKNGELLVSISVPKPDERSGAAYERFIPRNEMDIAVAAVAVSVVIDNTGENFESANIALASVGPTPIVARKASDYLAGKPINDASISEASSIAKDESSPISDMRGTIEHRKHLIEVLTNRMIKESVKRARG